MNIAAAAWHRKGRHPLRRVGRRILFIEKLSAYSVREALESNRPSVYVGQKVFGNSNVIVNDLALGEFGARIKYFVQVGDRDFATFDFEDLLLFRHNILTGRPVSPQSSGA